MHHVSVPKVVPPYGLAHVVPDVAVAAWGARAIVTQQGRVDIPYDRQGADGSDEDRRRLLDWLARRLPGDQLVQMVRDLLRFGVMETRVEEDFIVYMDDAVIIHANTNASAGYCYLTAWLAPNAYTRFEPDEDVVPELGPDAVGGDVQASDAWSARLVWRGPGDRWLVRTAYAFAVGCDEAGTQLHVGSGEDEPHHYEIDLLVDDVVCTDPEDPGPTEEWADITYPGVTSVYSRQTLFADLSDAETYGRHIIAAWLNAQPLIVTKEV